MKHVISFSVALTFLILTIIFCIEINYNWHRIGIALGWFACCISNSVNSYLDKKMKP
jgi:hypothetical protein